LITKTHASIASFPAKGNSKSKRGLGACSTLRYRVARDAKVVSHFSYFFWHSSTFFRSENQTSVCFFNLFSKPYIKLHSPRSNNQNIQRNKASSTSATDRVWPISGACGYVQHP
jgi:hypothetical protein